MATSTQPTLERRAVQWPLIGFAALVIVAVDVAISIEAGTFVSRMNLLLLIGLAMGFTLYHAAFGFTGAYRRLIVDRDLSGIVAQFVMLAVAMLLFAPTLASGEVFGQSVWGAVAPVSVSMAIGAWSAAAPLFWQA